MERGRVVRRGGDVRVGEGGADRVALGRAADEEVIDVARLVLRDLDELTQPELGALLQTAGQLLTRPGSRPPKKMTQR